jgi:hypothetical protein
MNMLFLCETTAWDLTIAMHTNFSEFFNVSIAQQILRVRALGWRMSGGLLPGMVAEPGPMGKSIGEPPSLSRSPAALTP